MSSKFYLCPVCGNLVLMIEDSGVKPFCCGGEMVHLEPGSVDASIEKHVPVFERLDECTVRVGGAVHEEIGAVHVKVGSQPHPMGHDHHIRFIWLETRHGGQLRYLAVGKDGKACKAAGEPSDHSCSLEKEPSAYFCTCKDPVVAVYEYCNLHGLWKLAVNE